MQNGKTKAYHIITVNNQHKFECPDFFGMVQAVKDAKEIPARADCGIPGICWLPGERLFHCSNRFEYNPSN